MINDYLLKGAFIGLAFGLPIGVVGILTIQRTIRQNVLAGLVSGIGASSADVFYAAIGIFGLTFISNFLIRYQMIISIVGGIFIIYLGFHITRQQALNYQDSENRKNLLSYYISSFLITLTNPVSILSFMVIFSSFGIYGNENVMEKIFLLLGIFVGTGIWWVTISCGSHYLKEKMKDLFFIKLNKYFGLMIIILGFVLIIRSFL